MPYANERALVSTQWVQEHIQDPRVRIAEVDYDPVSNYQIGHVPNAVLIDWKKDMNDPVTRDIVGGEALEQLLRRLGVNEDTTLVLYGDFNNWFAAFAFWVLKYYGFEDVRLMNGGRKKWLLEDRPVTKEVPSFPQGNWRFKGTVNRGIRVFLPYVKEILGHPDHVLIDVRSPKEYTGEILAPPEYPTEHAQRGGHIPTAINLPWSLAVNDQDGTFKSFEELKQLYESKGVTPDKEVVTYCRIGERASITWFVLTQLLGYPRVKVYDGGWTEWGNGVRLPIEKP
jgi:thiosulfate/3-mercaptopyruvate sulfurtransferase